jgi:hypothetical protein
MKLNFVGAATLAALALASMATAASAEDRHVNINNKTSTDMTELYASNTGTTDWQENLLGEAVLAAGATGTANIDDGSGYCKFDFKAVFSDGSEVVSEDNNVCEITDFDITE